MLDSSFGRTALSGLLPVALLSTFGEVRAQSEPVPQPPSASASQPKGVATLEPVMVTATRRREPARDVPLQVNTMTAESLERAGAKSLADYLALQPGVDIKTDGGAGLGAVNIRGVSTGNQPIATVGTYIDDVAFGSSSAYLLGTTLALDMSLLDLNHVELSRGPQGTLFGAGAMGGVLKYVTNEPDSTAFSGKVSLGGSVTKDGRPGNLANAVLNVPLKQGVAAVRVALFRNRQGGWIDATGAADTKDNNGSTTTGARVAFLIEPTERLKVRLSAIGQDIEGRGKDAIDYDFKTGQAIGGERQRALALREPYTVKIRVAAADIEYDMGWARFNSVTSVQTQKLSQEDDLTAVFGPLLPIPGLESVPNNNGISLRKQTQEIRLTSAEKGRFEWIAGLYYTHETGTARQSVDSRLAGGVAGPNLATAENPSTYIETAGFGDVTWNATDKLSFTGGLRVARNRQDFQQISDGLLVGGPTPPAFGKSADTATTYLATARYALTPTSNVYVRAASGYRAGGPNKITGDPKVPTTFGSDTLWSYEAGYKADLLDRTLSLEASVYDIRWKDIQNFEAINAINVIVNDGRAEIRGMELTANWRPSGGWTFGSSLSYIDAHALDTIPFQVASGERLPNSARVSGTLTVNKDFKVVGLDGYAGVTEKLVGDRNAGFDSSNTLPNYRMPGYAITDLQAGVKLGQFDISLYLRNAFDRNAQASASTSFVALGGPVVVSPVRPRTFGFFATAYF